MAERYWVTGVQLGMLKGIPHSGNAEKTKIINGIEDKQFMGSFPTDEDKKRFEKEIKKIV